jgi:hypothetical protein
MDSHDVELFEFGVAMYYAVNAPKELRKMEPKRVVAEATAEELPSMLRIPKDRTKRAPARHDGG